MLNFTTEELKKFKKLQNSKDSPGDIEKKLIEKTIKYVNYIKWAPGLKMIAIGNSVAMNSANDESDIDLFIVAAPNRIWIVRILITLIFQVLGVRKTDKHHKERFCLSFFCTTYSLNFEKVAIENDIYLYNRILSLKPILNYDNTYQKFIEENSKWMNINYECNNFVISSVVERSIGETNNKNTISKINYEEQIPTHKGHCSPLQSEGQFSEIQGQSLILNTLEKILKSIFLPKTKKTFEKLGKPFGVIINEDMLKFHNDDKRIEIRDKLI